MRSMPSLTDASESTSMAEIVIGSFSFEVIRASSGARLGLRIVADTLWPARPKASATATPMPVLVPGMRTEAMVVFSLVYWPETQQGKTGQASRPLSRFRDLLPLKHGHLAPRRDSVFIGSQFRS